MKKIIWVLANCNTIKEADSIGKALLKKRLASCYDIFPRLKAAYFWPPKSGRIETSKGAVLVVETLPSQFKQIDKTVRKLHKDKLPFVGSIEINNVSEKYYQWLKNEIK